LPWYSSRSIAARDSNESILALFHGSRTTASDRDQAGARTVAPRRGPDAGHNARLMPIPKNVTFVTFDVYGTLIDWETGIYEAFANEAERDGLEIDRAVLMPLFHEISREIEAGSYELYAEVLRRTAIEIAKRIDWPLEPSRSGFLPDSVQRWKPFRETTPQLQKLAKKYKLGLLSNIDDKLLGQTRRHIPIDFDLVVTAQQVRSYKPEAAHFTECARRIGTKRGWVHVASSHYHDVVPCIKQRVPVIWVNRTKEKLEASQKKPTAEVANLREAAKLLAAS
jgi:2-haloacid dehalogenase/putative hydrolase of the HAD superfamily